MCYNWYLQLIYRIIASNNKFILSCSNQQGSKNAYATMCISKLLQNIQQVLAYFGRKKGQFSNQYYFLIVPYYYIQEINKQEIKKLLNFRLYMQISSSIYVYLEKHFCQSTGIFPQNTQQILDYFTMCKKDIMQQKIIIKTLCIHFKNFVIINTTKSYLQFCSNKISRYENNRYSILRSFYSRIFQNRDLEQMFIYVPWNISNKTQYKTPPYSPNTSSFVGNRIIVIVLFYTYAQIKKLLSCMCIF
eukprot:TRINITY_DN10251_c0_g1_i6.p1 TRINITY_DN10251_c0_g1~~TRINITY_DN10251_c0_g1_i6.p1  ORF type:complete len:246 (+),score=-23.90 TRINITY_DN10251_c0_g1_i6:779-1516(+)